MQLFMAGHSSEELAEPIYTNALAFRPFSCGAGGSRALTNVAKALGYLLEKKIGAIENLWGYGND